MRLALLQSGGPENPNSRRLRRVNKMSQRLRPHVF